MARNFFQVFLKSSGQAWLDIFGKKVFADVLFEEIERYWKLDLTALAKIPFDIEECLTLFESQLNDKPLAERSLTLRRASFALRYLLLLYLSDLSLEPVPTPTASRFGEAVLSEHADVLTFNYDNVAEAAIETASGHSMPPRPTPRSLLQPGIPAHVPDDYIDASFFSWNRNLAYDITFTEVPSQ